MAQEVTILDHRKVPSSLPGRAGKIDHWVTFQVTGGPVLSTVVPDETFSDAALQAAIQKELELRGRLVGRKLNI